MRISIIAYDETLIDEIQYAIEKNNHNIQRINLSINQNKSGSKSNASNIISLKFTNFHDLTIEVLDFEPQAVIYFPINLHGSLKNQIERIEILHVELVEHIFEILQVVNCNFYFVNIFANENHPDTDNTDHLDFIMITDRRNKLIKTNSKSEFLFFNSPVISHQNIVDLLLDKLK